LHTQICERTFSSSSAEVLVRSRREFLKVGALGALSTLLPMPRGLRGSALALPPGMLTRGGLAELIVETERERVLERITPHFVSGISANHVLAAVLTAGARHVVPRSDFSKEHHVLLFVHAMQRAEERAPPRLRNRPALWAVDYFKEAQATARESQTESLSELPHEPASAGTASAVTAFRDAMEAFDGPRAEAAMVALHRAGDRKSITELLFLYGSKDLRHIGHKAIHVTTGLSALKLVGFARAEPQLRSIALTLALHYDEEGHDHDSSFRHNLRARDKLASAWQAGSDSREALVRLMGALRQASPEDAADEVVAQLVRGVSTQTVWDAMFLSGAELLLNNPTSIEALHAVTASNAAYGAFEASKVDATRRLLILQNASRVADFHRYVAYWAERRKRPSPLTVRLDELTPTALEGSPAEAMDELFADMGGTPEARLRAAQKTVHYLSRTPEGPRRLERMALDMSLSRGLDTHDFKLPAAAFEDATRLSPRLRPLFLAACTARFRGTAEPTTPLARRIDELV
jgi:hypothetical protein